jgi:hypothetical protein
LIHAFDPWPSWHPKEKIPAGRTAAPGDRASWLHLGHCLLELGELEAGYECFRAADVTLASRI